MAAPAPMATIDSPRAMMMISPWRSAKWAGTSFQPSAPKKYGPAMSRVRASAHRAPWSAPSVNAAATRIPTPTAVLPARPITDERRLASSSLATTNSTICPTRTAP